MRLVLPVCFCFYSINVNFVPVALILISSLIAVIGAFFDANMEDEEINIHDTSESINAAEKNDLESWDSRLEKRNTKDNASPSL